MLKALQIRPPLRPQSQPPCWSGCLEREQGPVTTSQGVSGPSQHQSWGKRARPCFNTLLSPSLLHRDPCSVVQHGKEVMRCMVMGDAADRAAAQQWQGGSGSSPSMATAFPTDVPLPSGVPMGGKNPTGKSNAEPGSPLQPLLGSASALQESLCCCHPKARVLRGAHSAQSPQLARTGSGTLRHGGARLDTDNLGAHHWWEAGL